MQILINVPEKMEKVLKEGNMTNDQIMELHRCVREGTPLPKGHGRLLILSEGKLKENLMDLDFSCQKWINEVNLYNSAVTIIEADKGG